MSLADVNDGPIEPVEPIGSSPSDAPPSALGLAPGVLVSRRYRLHRELGRGASGTVWEAEHTLLTSRVAIKFLDASRSLQEHQAEVLLERFRFEAQISARLASVTDRIVAVHDAGLFQGAPYIVMELAPGDTLADLIDRAPVLPEDVANVLDQIGQAVDAAHKAGFAHRDIKPANVLCQTGERRGYKLADFGVAKLFRDTSMGLTSPKETTANVLVGSPAYMCPEYVSGAPTTNGAGDVWALAVLAYEALTQTIPFDGEAWTQVAVAIVQGQFVPPSKRIPGLGPAVDAFFTKALSLDQNERFATAGDLARAFRQAIQSIQVPEWSRQATQPTGREALSSSPAAFDSSGDAVVVPQRKGSRLLLWGAIGVIGVLGVIGVSLLTTSNAEGVAPTNAAATPPPAETAAAAPPPAPADPPATAAPTPSATTAESAEPTQPRSPAKDAPQKVETAKPVDAPPPKRPPKKTNPSEVL